ncbi:MAG: ParB/RepB/Spo0J family partition protein, partial [Actinomycetota bacterium]|nr:ParB/RepB/Spo0J family partition protein [Actinomycetota bacterium]
MSPADDGGYIIVAGHRRHAAAQKAGLAEVPCMIRTLTDVERIEIMLVENLQRADLSAIEEAAGYFRLVEHGLSQKELARRIGRSARHVASRLALLELPKVVQDGLHAGSLTVGDGQALLGLREYPEVIERDDRDDDNGSGRVRTRTDDRPDPYAAERAKAKVRNRASRARIEFQQGASDRDKIRQAICALSNDLGAEGVGHLLIGIDQHGKPVRIDTSDDELLKISNIRNEAKILPIPVMSVDRRLFDGKPCISVRVEPSPSPPVRVDGVVYVRPGPTTRRASGDDERVLRERRRAADLSFDDRPVPGSAIADLDVELFRSTYLPAAVAPEV